MRYPILAGLTIVLMLNGCASFSGSPEPIIAANDEINELKSSFSSEEVLKYFEPEATPETRLALRNKIVSARLYAIDMRFAEYTQILAQELRNGAFGTNLFSIALSGAGTIITQGTTSRILSGIDSAVKSGRQTFDREVLVDKTLPILLTQMNADRKRIATQIWTGLATSSDADYSLPLALSQLGDYYQAGTMAGALSSVGESAAQMSINESKDFEDKVLSVAFGENEYTKILNGYLATALDIAEKNRRLLKIQEVIDKEQGVAIKEDDKVLANELIDTADPKYSDLQKNVIATLRKLGEI